MPSLRASSLPTNLLGISAVGILSSTLLAIPSLTTLPPIPLTLLSSASFSYLCYSFVGTLEQRRGEVFGLAACLPVLGFWLRRWVKEEEERKGYVSVYEESKPEAGEGEWRKWWRGGGRGIPFWAAALVGVWGVVGR